MSLSLRLISNHHESGGRDILPHLGAPPPLISPKPQHREHLPPPPTTLWNPASLIETSSDSRRGHDAAGPAHFDLSRPGLSLAKPERHYAPDKMEDGGKRKDGPEKYASLRPSGFLEPGTFLAELEKSTQSILSQQRASLSLPSQYGDLGGPHKVSLPYRGLQGPPRGAPDPALVYDEFLQQHRRLVSKLDLEERRRREAREKGAIARPVDSPTPALRRRQTHS